MIAFEVLGVPGAKGSPHARVHNGHVVMHERTKSRSWERTVRERAVEILPSGSGPRYVQVALAVEIEFRIARPSGHWAKRGGLKPSAPAWPSVKPDLDKLARSTLDALTGCVFDDDARIVSLTLAKVYAMPGREGAAITVRELGQQAIALPSRSSSSGENLGHSGG